MSKHPQHHRQAWSPSDDRQLRELARGNTPTRVIGLKLGRTEDAIYQRASDTGVSLRPSNQSPYNRRSR
jgi:hypothetical protein